MVKLSECKVVGLDLDLTLIDSTKSIVSAASQSLELNGYTPSLKKIESQIGIPIKSIFKSFASEIDIDKLFKTYQQIYTESAFRLASPMPGAKEFLKYMHEKNIETIVITAKTESLAKLQLEFLGMEVSKVVGSSFQKGKTDALILNGCQVYLGDHVEDCNSALGAGIQFIGIGKYWATSFNDKTRYFESVSSLMELIEVL